MNPFRYGQVVGGEDFCPRPELLQSLMDFIEAGQNVCLRGERRTGKTSLIHEATARLPGVRLLYIDLMETKTPADVCRRILTALVRAERSAGFHQRILRALSHLRPSLSLDPVTGLPSISLAEARALGPDSLEGILDMLADLGGRRRLLVAMDEFQDILDIRSSRETIALLRSRIQFQTDICYIFAGSVRSRIEAIFTDPESPFFKSAALLEVGPIKPDEFVPFLRRRFLGGGRQVADGVMQQVMEEAGEIPGDIQELCACLWDVTSPGDPVTPDLIEPALEVIFARERKAYEATLVQLTGQQLRCLVALARTGGRNPLSEDFMSLAGIGSPSSVQAALKRLIQLKIVYRQNKVYRLSNPFLGSWLIWKDY